MNIKTWILPMALLLAGKAVGAVEWSFTVLPRASIRYKAEAKNLPQSYVQRFGGITSPIYQIEAVQSPSRSGYWGLSLLHTGEFGGGDYALETVPDNRTGGAYQTSLLNVGFVEANVAYHRAVKGWPVEALFDLSIMRGFWKRKAFTVEGDDLRPTGFDDTNELSAEGFGFGLAGRHGDRAYVRWRALFNYYVQLADAKTDASYGQVFRAEAGLGLRPWRGLSLELGGLHQYWFIPGPSRRLYAPNGKAVITAWERQRTVARGGYLRIGWEFP